MYWKEVRVFAGRDFFKKLTSDIGIALSSVSGDCHGWETLERKFTLIVPSETRCTVQ